MPPDPDSFDPTPFDPTLPPPPRRKRRRGPASGAPPEPGTTRRPRPSGEIPPPRLGRRRAPSLLDALRDIPSFLKLLGGLMMDDRVEPTDKLLVAGAIAYVLLPVDLVPDWIPLLGEIDDVFLLGVAVNRLIENAHPEVLRDHWDGELRDLRALDLQGVLGAASLFLPRRLRRRLRAIGRV